MFLRLLKHQWLSVRRSSFWTASVVQTIFLGFFAVYMILMFLSLGFFAGKILEDLFPGGNVVKVFSGIAVYYFLFDIIVRFVLQKFPSLALKQYLLLNIPKSQLTHFVLTKSLLSFFNFLPLFAIIPFFFSHVTNEFTGFQSVAWLLVMVCFILISNFLSYFIDRNFGKRPILAIAFLGLISLTVYLEYRGMVELLPYFQTGMAFLYSNPFMVVIPIFILLILYISLFQFMRNHVYLEDDSSSNQKVVNTYDFPIFKRFDRVGKWMQLESKMIWRNKRSKQFLYASILFLLYPFFFMGPGLGMNSNMVMIFVALIMTGAFSLNYGQLILSWNSNHFDTILTQNLSLKDYLKAKYYLLALSNLVLFIFSLAYAFMNPKFVFVAFVMMLFNTGVTIWIYFFINLYNAKKIDPSKGSMLNYEGFGAAHYLIIFGIIVIPAFIYLIFKAIGYPDAGIFVIGALGLTGVIFTNKLLDSTTRILIKRKYKLQNTFSKD